jgi:opacity protein-like surface antigen
MHLFKTLMCLTLLSCSLAAQAQYRQTRDYVGGSFVRSDFEVSGESLDLNVLDLRLGVDMVKWLHIEGRVGFGLNDKSIGGIEVSINRLLGIYGVFSYPNRSLFRPYLVAGFTYAEVELLIPGIARGDDSETDVSFGAGIDVQVSDGLDVFLEYMQYIDQDPIEISGIALGLKFDF